MPFTREFVTWRSWGALVLTYAVCELAEEELSSLRKSCFKKKKKKRVVSDAFFWDVICQMNQKHLPVSAHSDTFTDSAAVHDLLTVLQSS